MEGVMTLGMLFSTVGLLGGAVIFAVGLALMWAFDEAVVRKRKRKQ